MVKNLLDDLNEVQKESVINYSGPAMVIAGAGSGKTRVLTYRVAYMLQQGIDPFNILALTFTNKAAREMKERIYNLVGSTEAKSVWMGTFHAIFARVLRVEGYHLGYPSNFTIYDTDDSKSLVRSILKDLGLDPKIYPAGYVLGRISSAKSNLISAQDYNANHELMSQDKMAAKPFIGNIYSMYTARCRRALAMDFDDLLFNMNLLLRDFPDVLLKYQKKFQYILVDEYQDTNYAQYLIVKKLAARHENICVVGDDAQSIYAFRGANIQNILNFEKDYPDLKTYKLEQNYRSTQHIVNAANSVIAYNKEQIFKKIWTQNEEGVKLKLLRTSSDTEEGQLVAQNVFEIKMNNQLPNSEFAVLYRTNAQSRSIEEALRKLNIPYRIYGGLSFYKRKEIKDLLAYFRVVVNAADDEAIKRIINYPARGIGATTLDRLTVTADKMGKTLWEVLANANDYDLKINQGILTRIGNFTTMIERFRIEQKVRNAYELARDIAQSSGILTNLNEDKTPEGISRIENIEELLNGIKEFSESGEQLEIGGEGTIRSLDKYLQDISLLTDADQDDNDPDKVSLMTIHSAKGLEFPYVFVVGMEENLFPSIQSITSRADLEEERRLFYVAITRARKQAILSYAENRYRWGNLTSCEPSRFLEEIDERYIDLPHKPAHRSSSFGGGFHKPSKFTNSRLTTNTAKKPDAQPRMEHFESSPVEDIQAGMQVIHAQFGQGKVLSIEGTGGNRKAVVFFAAIGQKNLLLKFARLKIVE
ncbi:MAG: 3'-5' exonuclease [Bacteroidales bacterium]|nr:3'-5' exonuclease [Bacteroidales bacterium]MDD3525873.1 3'-5' exonuclease [Bacteroidales bacterium]MDD4177404.1 3'-5' exonuclease [Bacteroidales bacterium]MDD4741294.1 3'-5' exonuclease [Bacteroidales bacterium]